MEKLVIFTLFLIAAGPTLAAPTTGTSTTSALNSKNIKAISNEAVKGGIGHIILNADSKPAIDNAKKGNESSNPVFILLVEILGIFHFEIRGSKVIN